MNVHVHSLPRMLGAAPILLVATTALADEDGELFERGADLYAQECAVCHQSDGSGSADFPALDGNDALEDPGLIASRIHEGKGAMMAFPDFDAGDIAAVGTYIRNAWSNEMEQLDVETAAAALDALDPDVAGQTIWDAVYTEEQAARGKTPYSSACSICHGRRLDGASEDPDMRNSPPLARARFLDNWDGQTLAALFEYSMATMPQNNPGSMSEQNMIDVIAYMLSHSGIPAGDSELEADPDMLSDIRIESEND